MNDQMSPVIRQRKILNSFSRALQRESHVLSRHPDLLWQQLQNRLQWEQKEVFSVAEQQINPGSELNRDIWFKLKTPYRQSDELGHTLQGHTDHVRNCFYSPDGERIISSSNDGRIIVWDASNAEQLLVLKGLVTAVSPDGRWIAAGQGKEIQLYDLISGVPGSIIDCHDGHVRVCSFSADSSYLLSGNYNLMLHLWNVRTGDLVLKLKNQYEIDDCSISPDGKMIVSTGQFSLYVWSIAKGNSIRTLKGRLAKKIRCTFSPDGNFILSSADDGTLSLFEVKTGQEKRVFEGHTDRVYGSAFSPDSKFIASASDDKTIRIWDVNSGKPIRTMEGHTHWVTCCAFSPDGKKIVSGSADNTLRTWDLTSDPKAHKHKSHPDRVRTCTYSPDGKWIASSGGGASIQLWAANSGEVKNNLKGHGELEISDCAFSSDSKRLVSSGWDGTLRIWDLERNNLAHTLEGHTGSGYSIDGRLITGSVNACDFSPDDLFIASAGRDGTVRIWDARKGKAIRVLQGHSRDVLSCCYSPDGKWIVSAGSDKSIIIWNADSGKQEYKWVAHTNQITDCCFSQDGLNLISSSWDHTIRIWTFPWGTLRKELKGHTSWVEACCFTPDNRYIVSAGWDRMITIWDADTGKREGEIFLPGNFHSLDLHPWKTELVCGDSGGAMYRVEMVGLQYGPLFVTAKQINRKLIVRCPVCQVVNLIGKEMMGKIIFCSNSACGSGLKVNNFLTNNKSSQSKSIFSRTKRI